jgi:glycosyltransferase involved in cell wall biosynthesis
VNLREETRGNGRESERFTVVVFVPTHPDRFALSIAQALERTSADVVVGVLYPLFIPTFNALVARFGDRVIVRPCGSVSQLINETYADRRSHLLVIDDAVTLPAEPFDIALAWFANDLRYSSVSFLSNASDFLSFPVRNLPVDRAPDGHDELSVTRALRNGLISQPTPIMFAAGAVVLLSAAALGAVGELVAPVSARFDIAVADFCVRAREKGFIDVVDTSTYVLRPSDVAVWPIDHHLSYDDRGWLLHRHQSMVAFVDQERSSGESPFALAHQVARVKLRGLTVLIDGSCFGPNEVGTQVATMHTIRALAEHPEVANVCVNLPGPVPAYAASVLTGPCVRTSEDPAAFGPVDIAYRPYQPTPGWDSTRWKQLGVRLVVSVLDTIAFHNGGYFSSTGDWLAYRSTLLDSVRAADAVTVISDDVIAQMALHRFPTELVRSIPLGTEHLVGDQPTELPRELAARGFGVGEFALCLGVNYTHKNRELAMAAHERLRADGFDLALVMAGASVPHGTTRLAESRVGTAEHIFVLPEVTSTERNWLLKHASLVWYPTSAEGFGLVPFEAAMFNTPTVAVEFGSVEELAFGTTKRLTAQTTLHEFGADVPVLAMDWTIGALTDVARRFLTDRDLAQRHCAALRATGARYSWSATADALVALFHETLSRPKR